MATSQSNASNSYGTTQSEKSSLPLYHVASRDSSESTKSTDALLQKDPKKDAKKTISTKTVFDCEF